MRHAVNKVTERNGQKMNCLCNLFDDPIIWLIIIALILLFMNCNNTCTCGNSGTNGFCGNSYNSGCGCGCGN